jgi:hypothetical protein
MFDKLSAFWRVFKTGEAVADPVAWKRGQMGASTVAALLAALVVLAKAFGIMVPVTDDQLLSIAGGVVAIGGVLNHLVTAASTDKIDLLGRRSDVEPVDGSLPAAIAAAAGAASTRGGDSPRVQSVDQAAARPERDLTGPAEQLPGGD